MKKRGGLKLLLIVVITLIFITNLENVQSIRTGFIESNSFGSQNSNIQLIPSLDSPTLDQRNLDPSFPPASSSPALDFYILPPPTNPFDSIQPELSLSDLESLIIPITLPTTSNPFSTPQNSFALNQQISPPQIPEYIPNSYIIELRQEPRITQEEILTNEIKELESKKPETGIRSFFSNFITTSTDTQIKNKKQEKKQISDNIKNEHINALNEISFLIENLEPNPKEPTFANGVKFILKPFKLTLFRMGMTGLVVSQNPKINQPINEYSDVFNGFSMNLSKEQAEKIKQSKYIKNVYQDTLYKATLSQGVPLIQNGIIAGKLDEDGEDCSLTGKTCLDGTGISIAIIDTGVDYAHKDFGGEGEPDPMIYEVGRSLLTPYNFGTFPKDFISLSEDRLVYILDWKLNILNLETNEYFSYSPYNPEIDEMHIVRVNSVGNNKILFGVVNQTIEAIQDENIKVDEIHMYDITSNTSIIIANINFSNQQLEFMELIDNKIYYAISEEVNNEDDQLVGINQNNAGGDKGDIQNNRVFEGSRQVYVYTYDLTTSETKLIYSDSCYKSIISSNQILGCTKDFYDSAGYNFSLFDLETLTEIEMVGNLPKAHLGGPILDISGNEIIYNYGSENNEWDKFVLYNIETGHYTIFSQTGLVPKESIEEEIDIQGVRDQNTWSFYAKKEGNLIFFFSEDGGKEDFSVYDLDTNRIILLIGTSATSYDIYKNKLCIADRLKEKVNCHDYNSSYEYYIPEIFFPTQRVVGGYDFVNNDSDPMDDHGHGTHVAGIAAGINGVAPNATIYAYKVLGRSGGSSSDIISAVELSADPNQDGDFSDRIDIISLSLGGYGDPDDPLSRSIDTITNLGVIAVISAGNSGTYSQTIGSPGTSRSAITVGAINNENEIAGFSSRGPVIWKGQKISKPDIIAPGVSICSTQWKNAWSYFECGDNSHTAISGTSMATPMVSGASALLLQENPNLNPSEIKNILKLTAKDLHYDKDTQGAGLIDISKALSYSQSKLRLKLEMDDYFLQDENSEIIITLTNDLSELVNNVNFSIYFIKEFCSPFHNDEDYCLNKTLTHIDSTILDIEPSSNLAFNKYFTFSKLGYITLVIDINIDGNHYLETRSISVKKEGSDIDVDYLETSFPRLYVDRDITIYSNFYNVGTKASENTQVKLYSFRGYCTENKSDPDYCLNKDLILMNNYNVNLDVNENEEITLKSSFARDGLYTLIMHVHDSNDGNLDNNLKITHIEIYNKTNIFYQRTSLNYNADYYVNQSSKINISLKTNGPSNFTNSNFSLYYVDYYENLNFIFMETQKVNLSNENPAEIIINFTFNKSMAIVIIAFLNSTFDRPEIVFGIYEIVKNNFTDYSVLDLFIEDYDALLNKSYCIPSVIANLGNSSYSDKFKLNLFINDEFKNNLTYDPSEFSFFFLSQIQGPNICYVPDTKGTNKIRIELEKEGDKDLSNNIREEEKDIFSHELTNVRFFNSQKNPASYTIWSKNLKENSIRFLEKEILIIDKPLITSIIFDRFNPYEMLWGFGINHSYSKDIDYRVEFFETLENEPEKYYIVAGDLLTDQIIYDNIYTQYGKLTDLLKYGFERELSNLDIVSCINFDFNDKKCLNEWEQVDFESFIMFSLVPDYFNIFVKSSSPVQAFAIVKNNYEFNGETTDLLTLNGFIENFIMEKEGIGKISFLKPLNFGKVTENNVEYMKGIMVRAIRIKDKKISVGNLYFNKPANLIFHNVSYNNPIILKDNILCEKECTEIIYNKSLNTVELNVTGFSTYTVIEKPNCGDLVCSIGETSSSCASDCQLSIDTNTTIDNIPVIRTGGGGGSGGGRKKSCTPKWECTWNACLNDVQKKLCIDLNNCTNIKNKPLNESRSCIIEDTIKTNSQIVYLDELIYSEVSFIEKYRYFIIILAFTFILIVALVIIWRKSPTNHRRTNLASLNKIIHKIKPSQSG